MTQPYRTRLPRLANHVEAVSDLMQALHSAMGAFSIDVREEIGGPPPVAVFGSAREQDTIPGVYKQYGQIVDEIGAIIARLYLPLVTGFCTGLPERVEIAYRLQRDSMGLDAQTMPIIGVHIELTDYETGHRLEDRDPTEADIYFRAPSFDPRIQMMLTLAYACIGLPGGIGTLLEIARYLQQQQLRSYTDGVDRTVILVGKEFWSPLYSQLLAMANAGTVTRDKIPQLNLIIVDTAEEVHQALIDHLRRAGHVFPPVRLVAS